MPTTYIYLYVLFIYIFIYIFIYLYLYIYIYSSGKVCLLAFQRVLNNSYEPER